MSGEPPGTDDWANPGWGTTPPTPPPPQGWVDPTSPAPPVPPPPAWGAPAPPPAPGAWANAAPHGWTPTYVQQAPKPGVIPLRPLGVGELLDGAFTAIRRYPAATLGLSAAVMLVVEAIEILTNYSLLNGVQQNKITATGTEPTGDYLARLVTADGIGIVIGLIAGALLSGALAAVIGQAALGRPMGFESAWSRTRPLALRLLGATLLSFLMWFGGTIPGLALMGAGAAADSDVLIGLGLAVFFLGLVTVSPFLYVKLIMVTPSLVLEKLTVRAAIKRSWVLTRGSWWRLFGIALLSLLISTVIAGVIATPFAIAGGIGTIFSGDSSSQFHFVPLLLTGIGGFLGGTVVRPFSAGVLALLYLDRRMRAEALDLTLQQAAANSPS
jgi:hypothetical protein